MIDFDIPFHVYAYVNPKTDAVSALYASDPLGVSKRVGGTWEPIDDREQMFADVEGNDTYELNWDAPYADGDFTDEGKTVDEILEMEDEHPAVSKFDEGALDMTGLRQYFTLVSSANAKAE